MSSEIRICPNCGAGVVGNTPNCPRCDFPLEDAHRKVTVAHNDPLETDDKLTQVHQELEAEEKETRLHTELEAEKVTRLHEELEGEKATRLHEELEAEAKITQPHEDELSEDTPPHPAQAEDELFQNAQTVEVPQEMIGASALGETQASQPATVDDRQEIPSAVAEVKSQIPIMPVATAIPTQSPVPPAPYTPPPLRDATRSVSPYSYPSNYYLEQRIAAYRSGGYELLQYSPYQVTLAYGKPLGFFWWIVAMLSVVGLVWYFLILLLSGFSKDKVFLIVERDGTLYEDGAGAAHVRRQRAKIGRRWGFLGVVIFFVSLLWFLGMTLGAVWGIKNYRAELDAAYPTVKLFESDTNPQDIPPETIANAESIVLGFSILFVLSFICLLAGLNLTIVGYLHSQAYDVPVIPLPA